MTKVKTTCDICKRKLNYVVYIKGEFLCRVCMAKHNPPAFKGRKRK